MITVTTTDGVPYSLPENGDTNWSDVVPLLQHLSNAFLQGTPIQTPQLVYDPVIVTFDDQEVFSPFDRSMFLVSGNGGPVSLNSTTPISAGTQNGATLIMIGTDDLNPVTIPDSGSLQINGPCTLYAKETIELVWLTHFNQWVELSRNN